MKLLIASDLHGSKFYVEELFRKVDEEKPDLIVLLGDLLYHGPRNPLPKDYNPQEVAQLLNNNKEKIVAVRGNCCSEVDQMVLEFPILSEYSHVVVDGYTFFLTHGHKYNPEQLPPLKPDTIFTFGHIHIPILKREKDYIILNPGSISLPKENYPHSYAIYEHGIIKIKTFTNEVLYELKI